MAKIGDILSFLDKKSPCSIKMDFDNVGLLAGDTDWETGKVLVALDITREVIEEAEREGAGLIVAHHPVFFSLKAVSSQNPAGEKVLRMLEKRIAGICMHTNLDAAAGGVNDALALSCGIKNTEPLEISGRDENGAVYGIGRIGCLEMPKSIPEYLEYVKTALKAGGLRFYDAGKAVSCVAVGSGSCGDYFEAAVKGGCDTYITADIKYDLFLDAARMGVNLIDAGHFCTENVVVPVLCGWIRGAFPDTDVLVSKVHKDIVSFY